MPPEEAWAQRVSALEDNAARAGAALGCNYSNAAEYEAALIAERRAAGAYGPRRNPWPVRLAAMVLGLAAVVAIIILTS